MKRKPPQTEEVLSLYAPFNSSETCSATTIPSGVRVEHHAAPVSESSRWCVCNGRVDGGPMVACDREDLCVGGGGGWFHYACVGIKSRPKGSWECPWCVKNGPQYCVCGYGDNGDPMVGCDREERCVGGGGGWFHYTCVGLKGHPRGAWQCPWCVERGEASSARRKIIAQEKEASLLLSSQGPSLPAPDPVEVVDDDLPVASAERQSRDEMEALAGQARSVHFSPRGALIGPLKDGCDGVARFRLEAKTFEAIQSLHDTVVHALRSRDAVSRLTPWAGLEEGDERERGYAFLPPSFGAFGKVVLKRAGLRFHAAFKRGREAALDEAANWRSCVRLTQSDVTDAHTAALEVIIKHVREAIPAKYRRVVHLGNLQAIQPNLHNSTMHLPPHLDYPLNDGFGIVIVTVCVRGDATILLLRGGDVRAERVWQFPVKAGDVYCLSADARNLCDHGVLVPLPSTRARARAAAEGKKGKGGRESMNLRFGLHGSGPQDPFPAHDEVLRQFDDDFVDEFKRRRADQL